MTLNWSQDIYIKAWDFATLAHEGQTYGGPIEGQRIPYINHIAAVAMETTFGVSSNLSLNGDLAIQCALLHDTIEDTDVDYDTIASTFGIDVAKGVLALTKNESLPAKREQMLDSLDRIKQQPKEVWMVKLADRITNLSAPPSYWGSEKREAYREEALLIHDFLNESSETLSNRLLEKIANYKKYVGVINRNN